MKTVCLEPSTNTHVMTNVLEVKNVDNSTLVLTTAKDSIVVHGEHGTLAIESENVIKYVQKEVNPITKLIQNSFD